MVKTQFILICAFFSVFFTSLIPSSHANKYVATRKDSQLEPSLGVVFPFESKEGQIRVSLPVLANSFTIIPKGALARNTFTMPRLEDEDVKQKRKKESLEKTFSRLKTDIRSNKKLSALQKAAIERAQDKTITDVLQFRAYFHKHDPASFHLVYIEPGKNEVSFVQFDYPEDLLLAEKDNVVTVLGVVKGSESASYGIVSGTVITHLNERALEGSLENFKTFYKVQKKKAQRGKNPLKLTVRFPDSNEEKTITYKLPVSLNNYDFLGDIRPLTEDQKEEQEKGKKEKKKEPEPGSGLITQ